VSNSIEDVAAILVIGDGLGKDLLANFTSAQDSVAN